MPTSYAAAPSPESAAARSAGPPMPAGNLSPSGAEVDAVGCGSDPVMSLAVAAAAAVAAATASIGDTATCRGGLALTLPPVFGLATGAGSVFGVVLGSGSGA